MLQFSMIKIHEWRQFQDINIELHPRLTIITGSNGSGKSTILSLLSQSLQHHSGEPFLSTPVNDKKTGESAFSFGTLFKRWNPFSSYSEADVNSDQNSIGSITYLNGEQAKLVIPSVADLQYDINLSGLQDVVGFKIDSHSAIPRYQSVDFLPVKGIAPKAAFDYFREAQHGHQIGKTYSGRTRNNVTNPVAPLKETLISFAAFGADNAHMNAVPELKGLFLGFQAILTKVLPIEIGFQKLDVRSPEIIVVTQTGEFPIDAASGGLMSLIQTTWQIFLFTKATTAPCVVLMDEPENHLHPSLQRDFLSKLVDTFDNIQFVVATHSPFIISSVRDSKIYALRYQTFNDDSDSTKLAVTSHHVDLENRTGSAAKILDEVLGVSVTIPIWAEHKLDEIAKNFENTQITQEAIEYLKGELGRAGLSEFLPEALGRAMRD